MTLTAAAHHFNCLFKHKNLQDPAWMQFLNATNGQSLRLLTQHKSNPSWNGPASRQLPVISTRYLQTLALARNQMLESGARKWMFCAENIPGVRLKCKCSRNTRGFNWNSHWEITINCTIKVATKTYTITNCFISKPFKAFDLKQKDQFLRQKNRESKFYCCGSRTANTQCWLGTLWQCFGRADTLLLIYFPAKSKDGEGCDGQDLIRILIQHGRKVITIKHLIISAKCGERGSLA